MSYRPDPEAIAIDAFSLNWSNLNFYSFPPFSVFPLNSVEQADDRGSTGDLRAPGLAAYTAMVPKSSPATQTKPSVSKSQERLT